ncbi:hypothetical protein R6Q57_024666 [Mikania cordata]
MPEKKQLVLVVEATAALGPYWWTIVSDYLQEIIRKFCGNEAREATSSIVQLALVQFHAHGSYSSCLVKRSSWERNVNHFLEWLSCMHFSGGGFCDAAIAEGLDEVLMIYHSLDGNQTHPTKVLQRHCILVAASNPYPLPTPVYQPPNKRTTNSLSNQSPSNMELTSVSSDSELPPTSASRGYFSSECLLTQQPVSVGNIPLATVEVEPIPVSPMASPQSVKTYSPSEKLKSSYDNLQDFKPVGNMQQPLYSADRVKGNILNNLSQARLVIPTVLAGGKATGISSIDGNPRVIHMSNMISGSSKWKYNLSNWIVMRLVGNNHGDGGNGTGWLGEGGGNS